MDVGLILKILGIGILVAVSGTILNKSGRDEQAMLVTLAGIVTVVLMLIFFFIQSPSFRVSYFPLGMLVSGRT